MIFIKFIFPQNYSFKNKLFGVLDYSTAIVNIIWCVFVFCFCNLIFKSLDIKIFLFVVLCLPLLMFSIVGFNHENILYVLIYVVKFFKNRRVYLYRYYKGFPKGVGAIINRPQTTERILLWLFKDVS